MNRTLAGWLADNPSGAVVVTGLLALLPFLGIGFVFFLPGAVPALMTLQRGPRTGLAVAVGASLLLVLTIWLVWQPVPAVLLYPLWMLGPPLLLAGLLARSGSLSLCFQVTVLATALLVVVLHGAFGDPVRVFEPHLRALGAEMVRLKLVTDVETFVTAVGRMMWGWIAVLTMLLAVLALFVARWWQSLVGQAGGFGAEFRSLRLGRALGVGAALFVGLTFWTEQPIVRDIANVLLCALLIVGLAAVHRFRIERQLHVAWLWVTYAGLFLVAPIMVPVIGGWGFVDNWLRSARTPAASAARED
jgi:hypothetical protein